MSVIITILAAVFIFGVIILVHELGHFLAARYSKIKVNEFAIGMGPAIFKRERKGTLYAIRLFPIGGFCSMEGENEDSEDEHAFSNAPIGKRILVIVSGAILNLLLGFIVIVILTATNKLIPTRTIHSFSEDSVTQASGLRVGDTLVAINGRNLYCSDDIFYELMRIKGSHTDVTVIRDNKRIQLKGIEFAVTETDTGVNDIKQDFYLVGISEKNILNVTKEALLNTVSITRLIFVSLLDLITGNIPINQVSGPVGIIDVIGQAARVSFSSLLYILSIITINLGAMNILPFPALDGGRLLILLIELFTKKRMNPKYEAYIHAAGFIILILFMLFVTYSDITKLFNRH
ncbi:MAG: site-2 protease family protein [Oscillospiraceae bacterium]|nr:site-2 protease family protein [Oscillospiraceae bacterium]